ncbi:Snf2 domain-containing protein classy 3 [Heracleum sosnowskyi]|uniref:Snf2 domain-containing protein classy 3 n=1 Tax=Heracleum sosnowskyi TaxID=360622 RepID=A0AAD8GR74_9APIA|nr:Snf2 domain-containing protein classy 3 [Heracleum sosnowskyi]
MDNKLPVAKRTRSGVDRILNDRCLKQRAKRDRKSGARAPVPEYGGVLAVECVNVDWEDDEEEFSEVKKCGSAKSRKSEGKGKKVEKYWHASDDDDDGVVVIMSSSDDGSGDGEDENLSEDEIDSDVMVVSVIDRGKGNEDDERVVESDDDDVDEQEDVKKLLSDSTSSEGENYYEDSDETYIEDSRSDHIESLDDSSSCDKSEGEGEDDSDDDVVKWRFWEKNQGRCKGKGRIVEGGQRGLKKTDKRKKKGVFCRLKRKVGAFEQEESNSWRVFSNVKYDDFDDDKVKCRFKGRKVEGGQRGQKKTDKRKKEDVCRLKRKVDTFKQDESNSWRALSNVKYDDFDNDKVKCKFKGRIVQGGQRAQKKTDKRKKEEVVCRLKRKVDTFEQKESNSWRALSNVKYVKGEDDSDNDVVKCRYWEKNQVRCKGKGRIVESGQRGQKKTEKRRKKDIVYRSKEENSGRYGQSEPEVEVVMMLSSSDDEGRGKSVKRDIGERRKQIAKKRKTGDNLDGLRILADSLHNKGEAVKKIEKEKPIYKFWFKDEDEKPAEKSDHEKHLDELFKELEMCLTFEQIGSTPLEVDNGDHCKTQTNMATLCSQGIHHLVLDEQIGIICKYCSHVNREIKHILPDFSNPSPQKRRAYFERSGCPVYSDDVRYTSAGRHDSENCNATGTVWDLVPGTRSSMYEHQREGFEFIWKNVAGGIIINELEKPLSGSGSGCIISHAPGTGKTRLTIIFLQSFMKMYPDSRPVIIAPKSMLLTWEEEFKKWKINMPFHNLNNLEFSGQENPAAVSVSRKGRERNSETLTRLVKLLSWKMDKSILGITYALFDKLVRDATKNADCTPVVEQMGKALLKLPTLMVLDEGHTPRNNQSSMYNSLLDAETERRIILSGTPFQNNFDELYNTLRLVNPKIDGQMKKSLRNISKGLKSKWSGPKLRELKGMISPFVHVHKGKILQKSCPGLKDALIRLQPTDLQQELIGVMSSKDLKAGYLELSYVISLVSVHPSLLPKRYFQEPRFSTYRDKLEKLERDPYSSAKTKFVVELCRLSEALNEKVLVYSQYIDPLILIKKQLQTYFTWTEGREVLYMDGNLEAKQRQSLISSLNDPKSKVRVLLASIKACSEGIHLVGASRVVLLDVVWNPSVERQAISRAYRIGQKKMVYTYHLIGEEMDSKKFEVQTAKDRLSEIVFSSNDEDGCKENAPNIVCEDEILQKMFQHNDKLGGMFKEIIFQPKESNLIDTFDLVAEEPN